MRGPRRHLLVGLPALPDRGLGQGAEALGLGRIGVGERREAQLPTPCTRSSAMRGLGESSRNGLPPAARTIGS